MAKQHNLPRFDADIYENFVDICNDILKSEGVKAEFEITASGKIRLKKTISYLWK